MRKAKFLIFVSILLSIIILNYQLTYAATIFSDGFESGDFSAWDGVTGTPEVVTGYAHHGTYSCKINEAEGPYKNLGSSYSTLYVRVYFKLTSYPNAQYYRLGIIRVGQSGTYWDYAIFAEVYQTGTTGSTTKFSLYDAFTGERINTDITPTLNQWYCVEVKFSDSAPCLLYIDGVQKAATTDPYPLTANRVGVGLGSGGAYQAVGYIDCAVVADTYIGPEGAQYSRSASQALTFSWSVIRGEILNREGTQTLSFSLTTSILQALSRASSLSMMFSAVSSSVSTFYRSAVQAITSAFLSSRTENLLRNDSLDLTLSFSMIGMGIFQRLTSQTLTFAFSTTAEFISALIRYAYLTFTVTTESARQAFLNKIPILNVNLQSASSILQNLFRTASQTVSFNWSGLGYIPGLTERTASLIVNFIFTSAGAWQNPSINLAIAIGCLAFILAIAGISLAIKKH